MSDAACLEGLEAGVAEVEDAQGRVSGERGEERGEGSPAERVAAQLEQLEPRVASEQGGEVGDGAGTEVAVAEPEAVQGREVEVGEERGEVEAREIEVGAGEDGSLPEATRARELAVAAEVGEQARAVDRRGHGRARRRAAAMIHRRSRSERGARTT